MSNRSLMISAVAVAGLIGILSFFFPEETDVPPQDQIAQIVSPAPRAKVEAEELELFIDVYKQMQTNRELTIDEVLKPHGLSVADFRDIERRVQRQSSLVERVRSALRQHAEDSALFPDDPES